MSNGLGVTSARITALVAPPLRRGSARRYRTALDGLRPGTDRHLPGKPPDLGLFTGRWARPEAGQ